MEIRNAISIFETLAQETRLRAFKLLVEAGHQGLPAGKLSELLGTPNNTMSFHLSHLSNAGAISSRKEGRSVIYSVNFSVVQDLIGFLVEDCCRDEFASMKQDEESGCCVIKMGTCDSSEKENALQRQRNKK